MRKRKANLNAKCLGHACAPNLVWRAEDSTRKIKRKSRKREVTNSKSDSEFETARRFCTKFTDSSDAFFPLLSARQKQFAHCDRSPHRIEQTPPLITFQTCRRVSVCLFTYLNHLKWVGTTQFRVEKSPPFTCRPFFRKQQKPRNQISIERNKGFQTS